jgi:hypothetical protein
MALHVEGLYLQGGSGRIFRFDDRAEKLLTGRFGFGMPPVTNRSRRAPYQQGESFLSSTVTPRVVNLTTAMIQCTRGELFLLRQELIRTNSPFASNCAYPMKLVWVWPGDKKKYYLNLFYSTGLEMNTASGPNPLVQNTGIQLIGYDPFWYDWEEEEETYTYGTEILSRCGGPLVIPDPTCFFFRQDLCMLSFPIAFGSEDIDTTITCTNSGDVPVEPVITFAGSYSWPRVENLDTGEYLLWDEEVPDGSTLIIDCKNKTIELDGINAISYKSGTFPDLRPNDMPSGDGVANGTNHLWFTGRAYCGNITPITINWRNAYLGY